MMRILEWDVGTCKFGNGVIHVGSPQKPTSTQVYEDAWQSGGLMRRRMEAQA
ncbi:hypothetical protein [Paenibacillus pabuli]|uniref:hypothetical protein n=1 Tax=Paenibacillus pabuli TaxID=1472 RepID=UPI000AF43ACF|nr:hypothetical protein [Paenibacillus pabuli]MEC0125852.1 hypothetical protein [Paenibacillus pabuli]